MKAQPQLGQFFCPHCERSFPEGEHCPADGTRLVQLKVPVDPLLGRDLDGRFTILEKLGEGGMGAVYRGMQHSVGREVAIKVVSPHLVSNAEVIKRFFREAKLASRLSHPNAVAVLEFGQTQDGLFYLVMELVTGRTLDQVIEEEKVFRASRVVRIGAQICDALEGAHTLQIVHRDLKPANVMVLAHGRDLVKVLDFGLAKSVAPDQASSTMTNAGALLGTPAFMPPEIALGQPCDGRADLYSLGCILYQLGTGQLPFVADSIHELISMHGSVPAPPMTNVPPALAAVVDRLLQKDPALRFQSAAETRDALEAALVGAETPQPFAAGSISEVSSPALQTAPSGQPRAAAPISAIAAPRSARRWVIPLVGLALLLAAAMVVVFFVIPRGDEPHEQVAPAAVAPPPVVSPPVVSPPVVSPPAAKTAPPAPAAPVEEPPPPTKKEPAIKRTHHHAKAPTKEPLQMTEPAGSAKKGPELPF